VNKIITKQRLLLALIFLFMVGFKIQTVYRSQNFNLKDDTGFFWTESALQQRSARLIATNGRLPISDKKAQCPEGLAYQGRLTVLLEITSGYIYRLFVPKTVPFHLYLIIFISIWSSLSIIPLYLSIYLLTKSKNSSLLGCMFYALTPAVYITVTAPAFELQDFALPLIFTHLYFFARAVKTSKTVKYSYAALSGAFLFVALSSWHLTQFYYALFVLFIITIAFFVPATDIKPFCVIAGMSILAGLLVPVLQTAGFLFSFSMLMSYGVILSMLIPEKNVLLKRISLFLVVGISILVTILVATTRIPEYSFVYGLMLEKIKHLGIRPDDPAKLSWETLVMWVSPFTSPSVKEIAIFIGTLLIVGFAGTVINIRKLFKKTINTCDGLFLFFTAAFLPLYLLLIRLDAFLIWFLSLQAAYVFRFPKKGIRLVLILCLCINAFLLFNQPLKILGPKHNYLLGIIKYIRNLTPEDAVVLTSFAYGPSIINYTERSIILHPKFEAKNMTTKVKLFEHKLFEPEAEFYKFCMTYGADYFVYQADMVLARGSESIRYRTHNLTINKDCVAYKLHFQPGDLDHFELIYSNPHYRVYRILKPGAWRHDRSTEYFRIYDEKIVDLGKSGIF
jgi:hypothetical protein